MPFQIRALPPGTDGSYKYRALLASFRNSLGSQNLLNAGEPALSD